MTPARPLCSPRLVTLCRVAEAAPPETTNDSGAEVLISLEYWELVVITCLASSGSRLACVEHDRAAI